MTNKMQVDNEIPIVVEDDEVDITVEFEDDRIFLDDLEGWLYAGDRQRQMFKQQRRVS